jgi:hypothetical protein
MYYSTKTRHFTAYMLCAKGLKHVTLLLTCYEIKDQNTSLSCLRVMNFVRITTL